MWADDLLREAQLQRTQEVRASTTMREIFRTSGIYTVPGWWREIALPRLPTTSGACILRPPKNGGVLVSTGTLSSELHAEDDSLASLKSRIKNINVNSNELALAA